MPANVNSPFLAERLIARLSPLRRGNLWRRILERANDMAAEAAASGCTVAHERASRAYCRLGRLAALS